MAHILIVYETKNGQTAKIAHFIADCFQKKGHQAVLHRCEKGERLDIGKYDAILLGGPVYRSAFPNSLVRWVQWHRGLFNHKPTAFFSVCLGILQKDVKVQTEERKIVEEFFRSVGWYPQKWDIFAGALQYSKYNWLIKFLMKRIARKVGAPTDTSKDYEYTNWESVQQFSDSFEQIFETKSHGRGLN